MKSEEIKIESDQISAKAEEKTEAIPNKLPVGAVGKKGRFMDTFQGEIECKTEPKPVVEEKTSESSASSVTAEQQQVKVDLQPEVSQSSTEEKSEPKGELNGHESEDERLARLISESEVSGRRILPPRSKRWKLGESLVTKKPKSDSDSEKSAAESSQSSAEENQSELSSDESDYQPLSRFKRNPSGKRQKRVKKERKEGH